MININLLPEEARRTTSVRTAGLPGWVVPAGMTGLVMLVASTLTLRQIQDARSLDEEIQSLSREKEKYGTEVALLAEVQAKRDELSRRVQAATALDTARGTYVRELSTLNDVLPANLWLTGVTEEQDGGSMRIEGRSLGPGPVFSFMRGLEASAPFQGTSLEYLKKDPDQEQGATAFVLTVRPM